MKTKIENLSFIVLISFQFGIGTDKTYSSEAISDLKKGKYFIDKCSSRDVIPLEESDNGCVEHNYVGRINLEGLNKLLWNWIYPDSITNTGGSLTLQYGLCEAIMFEGTIKQKHGVDTSLTIYKMNKAITGKSDTYPLPYRCQIAEGMAGYCTYSVCVTPVEETNGEYDNEEKWNSTVVEFTRENVLKQLEEDVRFGFEKALNQRGISASLMFECVMMWNYILEEGLESWGEDDYAFYGLPLFKATAVKYGWDNPIGEDSGRERKYDSQY